MDEKEFFSGETDITGNEKYDTVCLQEDACLCLGAGVPNTRKEQRIQINTLAQDPSFQPARYGFKCANPEGGDLTIKIVIKDLQTNVCLLSYGRDGRNGRSGGRGGDGADGYFGPGGTGGDGGDGTDGENGQDCPKVVISYGSSNGSVLTYECCPGKGGQGGRGGEGGQGGTGSDGVRANNGKNGCDGKAGAAGGNGKITIEKKEDR
jgi:hypothetical protein